MYYLIDKCYLLFKLKMFKHETVYCSYYMGIYFDFNEPIITNQTINTVTVVTSLPGISENLSKVFPNPARTYLQMQVLLPFQYHIYDLSGREIYFGSSASGIASMKIDQLPKGLYLLQIKTKNRMEYHKFIVE